MAPDMGCLFRHVGLWRVAVLSVEVDDRGTPRFREPNRAPAGACCLLLVASCGPCGVPSTCCALNACFSMRSVPAAGLLHANGKARHVRECW